MIIKCPKCSTGYNIPDEKLSDKPTKMRCSRCKTVFAITRRGGNVPAGYEEFTGRQSALPGEFAFLKHSPDEPKKPAAPAPEPPAQTAPEAAKPPSPPPTPTAAAGPAPDDDIVQKAIKEVEERAKRVKELKQAEVAAQPEAQAAPQQPAPAPAPVTPDPEQVRQPVQQVTTTPQTGVSDIYGGAQSAWEVEAPLELGSYEVETSSSGQKFGKIMFIITALIAAFLVYVAYRNGWSLSFANLGDQVEFAFSDKELEVKPPEVEGIEVMVEKTELINRKKKASLLVVTGNVFNNAPVQKSNVILRGRLYDALGEMRTQARYPCNKTVGIKALKKAREGKVDDLFLENGSFYNCSIQKESSTSFQFVFEDLPPDYNETFKVKIEPVSARAGK